jgi:hypothetical protein
VKALAAAAAAALALAGHAAAAEGPPPVEAEGELLPRIVLFGDTVTAQVDLVVDRSRVDPDSVRVEADFTPWELVADPERVRRDGSATTHVRMRFALRCLTSPCLPPRETAPLEFGLALVTYPGGEPIDVRWPILVVHSRIVSAERPLPVGPAGSGRRGPPEVPWRADVVSMPGPTYRVPPGIAFPALLALGSLFALGGVALAFTAVPRRRPAPPAPEEPPPPPLPPLEQALVLLEDPAPADGAADRRRALELVADHFEGRDAGLAGAARALAWSEELPPEEETEGLAARVRSALAEEGDA